MEDGGVFPLILFEVSADIHPSLKYVSFAFLNFCIVINLRRNK